jgi:hypothetical protein
VYRPSRIRPYEYPMHIHAHTFTCTHTIRAYIHHIYIHTYIHTHIHTHTHTHTYIHTPTYVRLIAPDVRMLIGDRFDGPPDAERGALDVPLERAHLPVRARQSSRRARTHVCAPAHARTYARLHTYAHGVGSGLVDCWMVAPRACARRARTRILEPHARVMYHLVHLHPETIPHLVVRSCHLPARLHTCSDARIGSLSWRCYHAAGFALPPPHAHSRCNVAGITRTRMYVCAWAVNDYPDGVG